MTLDPNRLWQEGPFYEHKDRRAKLVALLARMKERERVARSQLFDDDLLEFLEGILEYVDKAPAI